MLLNILKRNFCFPIIFILAFSIPTAACVCGGNPSLLDTYRRAEAVVLAKMTSFKKPFWAERPRGYKFEVKKIYKNADGLPKSIFISARFSDCDPYLEKDDVGENFMLYLFKYDEEPYNWYVNRCDRNWPASYAYTDLLYLNNMASLAGKTRIVGSVVLKNSTPTEYKPPTALANYRIKITGAESVYNLATDSQGVFEIYDVPPGAYFIECEMPNDLKVETNVAVSDMVHPVGSMEQIGADYLKVMNKFPDIIKNETPYYYVAPAQHVEVLITLQKK